LAKDLVVKEMVLLDGVVTIIIIIISVVLEVVDKDGVGVVGVGV